MRRRRHPQHQGMSRFKAGLIAVALIVAATVIGFTKNNPFYAPYKMTAVFQTANNLKPNSPVRIAGVEVGKVKKVEAIAGGTGAARVEIEILDKGLPIHTDATLKIRPRVFLEGNFFVDISPGSPSAPILEDDGEPGLMSTKKLPSRNTRGRTFMVASSWMGSAEFFISMVTIAAPSPLPPSSTGSTFLTLPTSTPAMRTGELGLRLLAVSNAPFSW